jgi:hypothetical protein
MRAMLHEPVQRGHHPARADGQRHGPAVQREQLLLQRAIKDPGRLSPTEMHGLQRLVGNTNVQRLLSGSARPAPIVQREGDDDDLGLGELFKSDEQKDTERAESRKGVYDTLPPGMDKYAMRKGDVKDFKGDISGVSKALSLPRLADGRLGPEAIAIMDAIQGEQAQSYVDRSRKGGFVNAPTDKAGLKALKEALKSGDRNTVTGRTRRPELMNLLNPIKAKGGEQQVVTPVTVGGTTMQVFHSTADVNFQPRLKSFEAAIKKIESAFFKLPPTILVHLPKFGGTIDAQAICENGGTPRAVFNPPNFVHLSPSVVGNPIDTQFGGVFKNLSTELDPEGPASVVHELGHMMHYHSSPSTFYGLHSADFKRAGGDVAMKVSSYASGNPREFVAEVFMGLVYGRTFDDDVIAMYRDFGGPISMKIEATLARVAAKKSVV